MIVKKTKFSRLCPDIMRIHPSIHGILVQLPLPDHLEEERILNEARLEKDVDGFNPLHIGNLAMRGREPLFIACTPKGCIELLIGYGIEITGRKAAVIGSSNMVGLPIFLLLQRYHATVSVMHAFTKNPEKITRDADIVVSAAGMPNLCSVCLGGSRRKSEEVRGSQHKTTNFCVSRYTHKSLKTPSICTLLHEKFLRPNTALVRGSWLKPGVVVIDIGTRPIEVYDLSVHYPAIYVSAREVFSNCKSRGQDPSQDHGYHLRGDVCYEEAVKVVRAITPVPGGVGPMTIAMLLSNALDAAKRAYCFS